MKRASGRTAAVLTSALLTLVTACGSTVQTPAAQSETGEGLDAGAVADGSVPGGSAAAAPGAAGGTSTATTTTTSQGGLAGTTTQAGPGSAGAPPVAGSRAGGGPAAVAGGTGPLKIGLPVMAECTGSCAAGNNSLGLKGIGTGATGGTGTRAQWKLLLDDLNARGGLFGRKLQAVFYEPDTSNGPRGEQAACTSLTQDNKVFVGAVLMSHTPTITKCLEKAGVVTLQLPGYMTSDAVAFRQNPHFMVAGGLDLSRLASVYVDGLYAQGFFDKTAVIGLVSWDTPEHNRSADLLKQALARHGLKLKEHVRTAPTYGVDDASATASQNQSAVLTFQTAGVNRVLFLGIGGSPGFFFITAAQAQHYSPRYGLTSNDLPESLRQQASGDTFKGAAGVGWWPVGDVTEPQPLSPAAKRCKALTGRTGDLPAYSACDALDVLARAAIAGGSPISSNSILAGLERVSSVVPSTMIELRYGPGRHDGVAAARHFAYADSCACWRYTSQRYGI